MSDSSEIEEESILASINTLLNRVGISGKPIHSFEELRKSASSMFVAIFEAMFQKRQQGIVRRPTRVSDYVHNAEVIINALPWNLEQNHITGEAIVRGDVVAICNLVDIFTWISEVRQEGRDSNDDAGMHADTAESDLSPPRDGSGRPTSASARAASTNSSAKLRQQRASERPNSWPAPGSTANLNHISGAANHSTSRSVHVSRRRSHKTNSAAAAGHAALNNRENHGGANYHAHSAGKALRQKAAAAAAAAAVAAEAAAAASASPGDSAPAGPLSPAYVSQPSELEEHEQEGPTSSLLDQESSLGTGFDGGDARQGLESDDLMDNGDEGSRTPPLRRRDANKRATLSPASPSGDETGDETGKENENNDDSDHIPPAERIEEDEREMRHRLYLRRLLKDRLGELRRKEQADARQQYMRHQDALHGGRVYMIKRRRLREDLRLRKLSLQLRYQDQSQGRLTDLYKKIVGLLHRQKHEDDREDAARLRALHQGWRARTEELDRFFQDRVGMVREQERRARDERVAGLRAEKRALAELFRHTEKAYEARLMAEIERLAVEEEARMRQNAEANAAHAELLGIEGWGSDARDRFVGVTPVSAFAQSMKHARAKADSVRTRQKAARDRRLLVRAYSRP